MILDINQTKLLGLTMELDLKAKEYKALCEEVDKLKEEGIDENNESLIDIRDKFQENHEKIVEIKNKLNELKDLQDKQESEIKEKYSQENLFMIEKNKKQIEDSKSNSLEEIKKDNFFVKFLKRIKLLISPPKRR